MNSSSVLKQRPPFFIAQHSQSILFLFLFPVVPTIFAILSLPVFLLFVINDILERRQAGIIFGYVLPVVCITVRHSTAEWLEEGSCRQLQRVVEATNPVDFM